MIENSWEHRRARMQNQVSKMDWMIYQRLKVDVDIRDAGWRIEWQKPYCLLQTTPEFTLAKGDVKIGVYLDGEKVHLNKQLRDEEVRDLLEKRKGVKPLSLSYPRWSQSEEDRIFKQIKGEMLNGEK